LSGRREFKSPSANSRSPMTSPANPRRPRIRRPASWKSSIHFAGHSVCQPAVTASRSRQAHLSLDIDNLYPIRAIADWKATGLAQLPGALVALVDRQAVRPFPRSDQILAARIDLDAARLRLGREIGDVGKLARFGRHREQGDLVAGALG